MAIPNFATVSNTIKMSKFDFLSSGYLWCVTNQMLKFLKFNIWFFSHQA